MCEKRFSERFLNWLGMGTFSAYASLSGYTFMAARSTEELAEAFRIRCQVYMEAGYIPEEQCRHGEMYDEYDNHSVVFVAYWRKQPVGTIRLTPLKYGSPVLDLFNVLELPPQGSTMEIGRFAVLPRARETGRVAALGLVQAIYRYSCQEGVKWWIGYTPRHILRSFGRLFRYEVVPVGELSESHKKARESMRGYFERYGERIVVFRSKVADVTSWRWISNK